jgi:hypothetical protein
MSEFEGVVAVKGAGLEWRGRLDAWVSLHPERLHRDIARRQALGMPGADRTYGHKPAPGVSHVLNYRWPDQKSSGSSGLFGVRVALDDLMFDKVVLCGMPLVKEFGRIDQPKDQRWRGTIAFRKGWEQALHHIRHRVRSMSGWTKDLLGEPTPDWLE